MCLDPASMAAMSNVLQVVGIGVTVAAQQSAAKATANTYEYQAKMNERNAEIATNQAKDASDRGFEQEQALRRKAAAAKSTQKTAFAAQGSDLGSGSPLDILSDTAFQSEQDAAAIRYNAQLEKYDLLSQGQNMMGQANLDRYSAANARTAGKWNMASTLLTGASAVSSRYAQYKKDYPGRGYFQVG